MPDTPVADAVLPPYIPPLEARVARLETEMSDVKSILGQMMPTLVRIDTMLTATLPHLATKAELADLRAEMRTEIGGLRAEMHRELGELRGSIAAMPSKTYMWGILATLVTAYAAGLAGIALLH